MGVCAFAPFGWRLHGGGAFFLLAGGLPAAVPWVGWRGLRDARFKPEAATGEAFFLDAGGEPCRWLPSGWRLHGGCVLPLGGRSGWTLPRSRRWLAGIGPARSCPSCWRPQQGARSAGRTEARSADIGAGGAALDLALAREVLRNPTPSRRRPQRGCSRAHDKTFAGGAVCLELGSLCLFCQTGLRLSGHCGAGWRWTAGTRRWGGGVVEPAGGVREGLPRLSPSLCFGRWAGRAFCLGRWMGVCLRLHPGRWPQGEGRSAVWCGGRWRVLPLGRMKRGGPPGRGRPGDADVDQGDTPASPGVSGCRGDGVRPCGWGAVG